MVTIMKALFYKIKRFFWLIAVFIVRILFAKRKFKVQFFKSIYYNFNGGFTANQVALYNLNKKNKGQYLSEFDWYKSRRINYPNGYLLDNKLVCVNLVEKYVNTPKTLFEKQHGKIKTGGGNITSNEAIKIIKKYKSVFFKPISVGKGIGVFRIDYKDDNFYIDLKKVLSQDINRILETKDNYFVSVCVKQSKFLNNIYKNTSNTIRLVTARNKNGKVEVLCAVQRIGTSDTIPVDNGSRGGLVANIDLKTGVLSEARSIHNKNVYQNHPDSNARIKGIQIPNWNNLLLKMVDVAEKLQPLKFIAWDILLTDSGFYVIEANSSSGVNIFQIFKGQRNEKLGDFYREQGIIK